MNLSQYLEVHLLHTEGLLVAGPDHNAITWLSSSSSNCLASEGVMQMVFLGVSSQAFHPPSRKKPHTKPLQKVTDAG